MSHTFPLMQFLDTNGDGTGDKNAIGDYSAAPVDFSLIRPEGSVGSLFINSLYIALQSPNVISAAGYGATVQPLTNGIILFVKDETGGMPLEFTSGIPVKANSDWTRYGAKTSTDDYRKGEHFFRATFRAIFPTLPFLLPPLHSVGVTLNDDFSGLISHTFFLEGTFT